MSPPAPESFAALPFADSQVLDLASTVGELAVTCTDWQEQVFVITFTEVIGYEGFGIEGEDLSHGTVSASDPLIARASHVAHVDPHGLWCFAFWSAWHDQALLRVVARQYHVVRGDSSE